jgi:hypothetical protein
MKFGLGPWWKKIFDTEIMITLFFYLEIHIGKAA